jgi:ADP-ribose pyrophosphatase YjhB (NUDIX family)
MLRNLVGKIWRKLPRYGRRAIIRLTQTSFTVSSAVIIFDCEGRVLLLNHVLRPASGWGLPGGFLEPNEQPSDAAKREVREEVSLEISNLRFFRVYTIGHHVEIWFTARAAGEPKAVSREILEARWFALKEMPPEMPVKDRYLIFEAMTEVRELAAN